MGILSDLMKTLGGTLNPEGAKAEAYIEELCAHEVLIGYQDDSGSYPSEDGSDAPTVAEVAAWNEYGTENAPARPFMRQTLKNREEDVIRHGHSQVKKELKGSYNAQTTLNAMGAYVKGCIQKEIVDGEFEPNAPSTIAKKGSEKPLIDTGRMRQSVTYVIK